MEGLDRAYGGDREGIDRGLQSDAPVGRRVGWLDGVWLGVSDGWPAVCGVRRVVCGWVVGGVPCAVCGEWCAVRG